jgi:8-oxo-dGTP diphosphatase
MLVKDTLSTVIRVGIGVMIFKDGRILMGKRRGSHGAGEYAWPGGHLEYMEAIEECARREVREETGMEIDNVRFLRLLNLKHYAPKHYLDIGLAADWRSGEAQVLEPDKIESWGWYDPKLLPAPLFFTLPSYFEALESGRTFFDA